MTVLINIDGKTFERDKAVVSVLDHGFLFGDSVYEVLRTHRGRLFAVKEHFARLRGSAEKIALTIPASDAEIEARILHTIEAAANPETYVRLIVSRGIGELELNPATCKNPRIIIIIRPHAPFDRDYYEKGVTVALVGIMRNPRDALNPQIKSGNYLNNILALMEARSRGALEAVMLNHAGHLAECTTSNIFTVSDRVVRTPPLGAGILSGITRSFVISIARDAGFTVEETDLVPGDLFGADEAFLTGTLKNVMPVTKIDSKLVADGLPGPVTKTLMERFGAFLDDAAS